jgi:hypothetical protein
VLEKMAEEFLESEKKKLKGDNMSEKEWEDMKKKSCKFILWIRFKLFTG